jgi:pSer/pThr/pTyr-binding forkhead associated (FHA) protein
VGTGPQKPTHILYKNRAYPLSAKPLIIAKGSSEDISFASNEQPAAGSGKHCTIHVSGDDVVLTNCSTAGTYVDTAKVAQTTLLQLGQTIRLDPSGEELKLIVCVSTDET